MKKITSLTYIYNKKGQKTGVILKPNDFDLLLDELEDFHDYEQIKKRIEKKEKSYSLKEVKAEILGKK